MATELDWKIEDFRTWLSGQAPGEVVGKSDSCEECPIATWRRETDSPVSVSADNIVFMRTRDEFEPPEWVTAFVVGIDDYHSNEGEQETEYLNEPVTVYECLEVLDQVVDPT